MAATKYDLRIEQGKTVRRIVRWETTPLIYKPITAIANVAPALITAVGHVIPAGWRTAVIDVVGMREINAKNTPPRGTDWHRATVVGPDTVSLNDISAASYDAYVSGGYLMYYTPMSLAGYSARMNFKDRVGGTILDTIDSTSGEIVIDTANFTVTFVIPASLSAAYTWTRGVYDLEMYSGVVPNEEVTAILTGAVTVTKEVTTSV
jgi:hypothetical protein